MSASQLFDWPTAKAALNKGWRVRRNAWTDARWLERWTGGLIWLILSDGTKRVVLNTDFGADEFNALDWTNLPPECVTAGTTAGTGTNGCPLPYSPNNPVTTPSSPATPVDPSSPPSGGSGAGQTGSGGGSGNGSNTPRRDPQNIDWPTISLSSIMDNSSHCYDRGTDATVSTTFSGTVSLSLPSGYNGPSGFLISIKCGSTTAGLSLSAGNSQGFELSMQVAPGSTLTFTARAWAQGAPDIQTTGTGTANAWCDSNCPAPTCCPGEDGHKCGNGCCCCPAYYAPNGPNCQCIYVG